MQDPFGGFGLNPVAKDPLYGELDNSKNKQLFATYSKRKVPDSPVPDTPPKTRKNRGKSGLSSFEGTSTGDTNSENFGKTVDGNDLSLTSSGERGKGKHPLDIAASSLTRNDFRKKHPFINMFFGDDMFKGDRPNEAVHEVAVTALSMAIQCQDSRTVLGRPTEAQTKDVIHSFHQGLIAPSHGDLAMREREAALRGDELAESIASHEGTFVIPEDSSDQGRAQRVDLNVVKRLKSWLGPGGEEDRAALALVRSSLQEREQKAEVACFTNEQKRNEQFAVFDVEAGDKPDVGSQTSEYAILKCCKLVEEVRTKQADYGISATSLDKYRLGVVVPRAIVVIPDDGDYGRLTVVPLHEEKGGQERLAYLEKLAGPKQKKNEEAAPEKGENAEGGAKDEIAEGGARKFEGAKNLASLYRCLIKEYSDKFGIEYRGRFLVATVYWSQERTFLTGNALRANPENIYKYVRHFIRYTSETRLEGLSRAGVIAAREASIEAANEAARRRMGKEVVDGDEEWNKHNFFVERMEAKMRETARDDAIKEKHAKVICKAREQVADLMEKGGADLNALQQLLAVLSTDVGEVETEQ